LIIYIAEVIIHEYNTLGRGAAARAAGATARAAEDLPDTF